jgi:hypothetical protein
VALEEALLLRRFVLENDEHRVCLVVRRHLHGIRQSRSVTVLEDSHGQILALDFEEALLLLRFVLENNKCRVCLVIRRHLHATYKTVTASTYKTVTSSICKTVTVSTHGRQSRPPRMSCRPSPPAWYIYDSHVRHL